MNSISLRDIGGYLIQIIAFENFRSITAMSSPIILACQGRSGSTTLMRIMNSVSGCNICGENWNMIGSLLDFYENMKRTTRQPGYTREYNGNSFCSWYNVFDPVALTEDVKKLIRAVYESERFDHWGFKEIRFGLEDYGLMETRLNNFAELFPEVRIVFLVRNDVESQLNSGWWADDKEESRKILNDQLRNFSRYSQTYPLRSYMLSMESMLKLDDSFRGLSDFLGIKFDEGKISDILRNKVDYEVKR